jgi:iron complex transport system ATP-binding protein
MTTLVSVESLSVSRNGARLLEGLSFAIAPGEKVAIVGPNGAGKSTLLKVLAGIIRDYVGSARFEGRDIKDVSPKTFAHVVTLVQQRLEYVPSFSVSEFLALSSSTVLEIDPALAGLDRRLLSDLSGGELQRVVLAGAVAQGPRLLLMDEPTAHLDPTGRKAVEQVIRHCHEERGMSYMLVTHDIELAQRCAERIVIMREGRITWDGASSDPLLVARLADAYGCSFVAVTHPVTGEMVVIPG